MIEICEIIMLVCFGLSWPTSLIKNIKSKTAKGMNLPFTCLIILGYVAGMTAKILGKEFTFVFVMYILNLVVVCGNLIVYFINKTYDRHAGQK